MDNNEITSIPAAGWWRPDIGIENRDRSNRITGSVTGPTDSPVPFWCLIGFTFILLISPQSYFPLLGSLRIALVTAVVALTAYLWDRIVHRRPFPVVTREIWIAASLAGWAALTIPFSYWPGGSVSFLLDVYLKTLVIFWLITVTVNRLSRFRQMAWGLTLMGIPVAMTAIGNYLSGVFIGGPASQSLNRIVGYEAPLTENPNDLALMLNLILPLTLALWWSHPRRIVRIILLAVVALDVLAVIATFSRAGFLELVFIFLIYSWKYRDRYRPNLVAAVLVVALACLALLPTNYVDHIGTILNKESDQTGSASERWNDMAAATNFVFEHPILGAGIGMNILALNKERGAHWRMVHNLYLEYAVDLGLIGLSLFLVLQIGCFRLIGEVQRRSARMPKLHELSCLAEGVRISLAAFSVGVFFYPVAYQFYFYYLAGLAIASSTVYAREFGKTVSSGVPQFGDAGG